MADFNTLRSQLRQARQQLAAAEEELVQSRQKLSANEGALARLRRRFDAGRPADVALLDELTEKAADLEAECDAKLPQITSLRQSVAQLLAEFALFSDPRTGVERLKDHVPLLLLPLRIETRFKKIVENGVPRDELWVRIYPDDCLIDTFDPTLSEVEIRNARRYWQERWRAGGAEPGDRAAWRGLVTSHGSGRAEWIEQQYRPLNLAAKPVKNADSELILAIATEAPLPAPEEPVVRTFWSAMWLADRDAAQEKAAIDQLAQAVGQSRARAVLDAYRPFNLADPPPVGFKRSETTPVVSQVVFPKDPAARAQSWSRAPRVEQLPNRFVLLAYKGGVESLSVLGEPVLTPLIVGPDPLAPKDEQMQPGPDGTLNVPDDMKWMVEFQRALAVGMGFRVELTPAQAAQGFDRLYVLGVRLEADENDGRKNLEALLRHHRFSRTGLAVVPQGTPTNNVEGQGTGFSSADDPDDSFDRLFKPPAGLGPSNDALKKSDGHWLAEWLGIDPAVFSGVAHSRGDDQSVARAMNRALWPATGDYFLRTMLHPIVSDETLDQVRWFFTRFVSGRGPVPAIRIGKQPYGILPTTDFRKIGWLDAAPIAAGRLGFLKQLYPVLQNLDSHWAKLGDSVSHVGDGGADPHQTLLNILGLHPTSAEHHFRVANNLTHLFNLIQFDGLGASFLSWKVLTHYREELVDLIASAGPSGGATPDALQHFFTRAQGKLKGVLVGTPPRSETAPIDPVEPGGRNYLYWLLDAAFGSLDVLRTEKGFPDQQPPRALLYLLLRHAILLGYHDAAYRLFKLAWQNNPQFMTAAELAELRREPHLVHVAPSAPPNTQRSESRWRPLYTRASAITIIDDALVWEHVNRLIHTNDPMFAPQLPLMATLLEQLGAIRFLLETPVARLERALVEHIDCCGYRFDAWRLGFANVQLAQMRYGQVEDEYAATQKGIYLGAFAWVENLRSDEKDLTPVTPAADLATVYAAQSPLVRDSTNGGYVHAPSLNHAVTAAVLRNGYLSRATPANKETLQVNLSSERVRTALQFMEGMRQGQGLGPLLGYQLERGLHDRHTVPGLDALIYDLRKQFPLRANQFPETRDKEAPVEKLEARNVIDGLKLVEQIRASGAPTYPFGLPVVQSPVLVADHLPALTPDQQKAVNAEVDRLLNIHDALGDLALAEGVHQATQGNFERAAATLEAFMQGSHPPEPSVVRTPTQGITLTHRVGLHLKPGLGAPTTNPTPRSAAEPGLNDWLAVVLPPLDHVSCKVKWKNPINGADREEVVSLHDLKLQPLDVLQIVQMDDQPAMAELDDRVSLHVSGSFGPRPDATLSILYRECGSGHFNFFEVSPLVHALRSLVRQARPLRADDLCLPHEATEDARAPGVIDRARIASAHAELLSLQTQCAPLLNSLEPLALKPQDNSGAILAGIDGIVSQAVGLLKSAARFGIPQSGWGFALDWKHRQFATLIKLTSDLVTRWDERLLRFTARMDEYNALPGTGADDERFSLLHKAEQEVSTAVSPNPATPALLLAAVTAKGAAFKQKRNAFAAILPTNDPGVSALRQAILALLPVTAEDYEPFELEKIDKEIVLFPGELFGVLKVVAAEVKRRQDAAKAHLDAHDATADATRRLEQLTRAAKVLFGDEFQLMPEFSASAAQQAEWKNALAAGAGKLFDYLKNPPPGGPPKTDFPADDWLYGVARVRPQMRRWEQTVMCAGAFGRPEPGLLPVQFPFRENDTWLGLDYPPSYVIDRDRLLYTAHYPAGFDPAQSQCGLLLDEWAEGVPSPEPTKGYPLHETAISFHYDRPNNEAPQTWLLMTPANWNGKWEWGEIVGALGQTLDLCRTRAVEPQHIDATPFAQFLPAVLLAATKTGISISTLLAENNPDFNI